MELPTEVTTESTPACEPPQSAIASRGPVDEPDGVTWSRLHPNIVPAERIAGMIFTGVASILLVAGWAGLTLSVFDGELFIGAVLALVAVAMWVGLAWLSWFTPQWKYDWTRWREVQRGFELQRGRWWRHSIYVPRDRIQHTDVVRGPLMRRFDLATLVIHTAGTHNHQIVVDGLDHQQAEALRQSLLPQDDRGL